MANHVHQNFSVENTALKDKLQVFTEVYISTEGSSS